MSTKDSAVGSVRPRSPGSPSLLRPSKVQKVSGLRWSDKAPMENEQVPAAAPTPRKPMVIRKFDASSIKGTATFTCTSGELLWGHLNTVIEGSKSEEVDTTSGPHETRTVGTIIQDDFRYKAKARKGVWKVEPAFIGDWHIGYVCYHEGVDGLDILRQAADVGISNAKDLKNREVVYVNRYDWGHWHSPGLQLVLETLGLGLSEDDVRDLDDEKSKYFWHLISTRFMLLDPKGLPSLIQALKGGEKLDRKNYLFHYPSVATPEAAANGTAKVGETQNPETANAVTPVTTASEPAADTSAPPRTNGSLEESGNGAGSVEGAGNGAKAVKVAPAAVDSSGPFGVNLVTKNTEYELGWMLFEKGELVGFVYDGEYSALEIYPEGSEMKLGGTVVTGLDHDSEDEEDPPYTPSSSSESTDSEPSTRYYVGSETESEAESQATSANTAASKETQGGDEEQGEESMSKDVSASAPKSLDTIHEEEDGAEPSAEQTTDAPQPIEDEKAMAAAPPGSSSLA